LELYPIIEKSTAEEIKKFQESKLKELLIYLQNHSPFYQKLFKENHIDINEINTLEDLRKIPTTEKNDIQQNNDDFFVFR
jgi:phenylacetate-CoA ligase